jgi:NTE family protein
MTNPSRTALVLAGAVAKGAFQAGALEVLHARGVRFSRVVATSAGAINGAFWAAAVRAGREDSAALELPRLWLERARLALFDWTVRGILTGRGLSTSDNLERLLEAAVGEWLPGRQRRSELRLVVTALAGVDGVIDGARATTFQEVLRFDNEDFDSEDGRKAIFRGAAASGAFPGAFVPVDLPGPGTCVDGGVVNNTPVKEAIEGGAIDRIVVVSPNPLVATPAERHEGGLRLLGRIVDVLINERLYRDLREAHEVNAHLKALEVLHATGVLDDAQLEKVKRAVDLDDARWLEIVQIRPERELEGNPFDGFRDRGLRARYIEAGRRAAERALPAAFFTAPGTQLPLRTAGAEARAERAPG